MLPLRTLLLALLLGAAPLAFAQVAPPPANAAPPKVLLDKEGPIAALKLSGSSKLVTTALSNEPGGPGLVVTVQPGSGDYPGINLDPDGGKIDLSKYSRVQARITNLSDEKIPMNLRLDNAGDWSKGQPVNAEVIYIQPRGTSSVTVRFGQNYGHPGYALKPDAITKLLIFTGKVTTARTFRVELLEAAGFPGEKPPETPVSADDKRIKPAGGILFGANALPDPAKQFNAFEDSRVALKLASPGGSWIQLSFPANKPKSTVQFKPVEGRWDLHDALEVTVVVRNSGQSPVTPAFKLDSNGGPTEWFRTAKPIAPGAEGAVGISFIPTEPVAFTPKPDGKGHTMSKGAAAKFASDAVSGVIFSAEGEGERALSVTSVVATIPPPPKLPETLGKEPPVPGAWKMTFSDDFNGPELDRNKWQIASGNYWDKKSHFSKDNIEMKNGTAFLRFEKKRGFNNDNPKETENDYQTGYLDSLNHFAQLYGYWESRVKVPSATGLWPAFWLMPDRGKGNPGRSGTNAGGMEFDIWEPLTKWGKYRYNIAMHYDNYGKDHKALGTSVYAPTDKDGYMVVGLLWTPGSAIYYANGREVLRWEDERVANVPMYIIYTMVSGGWDNDPIDDAKLPTGVTVDWVRVWQRDDLANLWKAPVTATPAPAAEKKAE